VSSLNGGHEQISNHSVQASTCVDEYSENMVRIDLWDSMRISGNNRASHREDNKYNTAGEVALMGGVLFIPAALIAGSAAVGAIAAGAPAAILIVGQVGGKTIEAISNTNERKMIRLIDQAEKFVGGERSSINLLRRLHRKISKFVNLSLSDLAKYITDGNIDGSLCDQGLLNYRELKKGLKDGSIREVNL